MNIIPKNWKELGDRLRKDIDRYFLKLLPTTVLIYAKFNECVCVYAVVITTFIDGGILAYDTKFAEV